MHLRIQLPRGSWYVGLRGARRDYPLKPHGGRNMMIYEKAVTLPVLSKRGRDTQTLMTFRYYLRLKVGVFAHAREGSTKSENAARFLGFLRRE
jgi:hypothetical protein